MNIPLLSHSYPTIIPCLSCDHPMILPLIILPLSHYSPNITTCPMTIPWLSQHIPSWSMELIFGPIPVEIPSIEVSRHTPRRFRRRPDKAHRFQPNGPESDRPLLQWPFGALQLWLEQNMVNCGEKMGTQKQKQRNSWKKRSHEIRLKNNILVADQVMAFLQCPRRVMQSLMGLMMFDAISSKMWCFVLRTMLFTLAAVWASLLGTPEVEGQRLKDKKLAMDWSSEFAETHWLFTIRYKGSCNLPFIQLRNGFPLRQLWGLVPGPPIHKKHLISRRNNCR